MNEILYKNSAALNSIIASDGKCPEQIMVFKGGLNKCIDGREYILENIAQVIEDSKQYLPVAIDLDHGADVYNGSTEAAGWINDLTEVNGDLMASVEWTSMGADKITKKLYRYWSPSFYTRAVIAIDDDAKRSQSKIYVTRIIGGGLTNRPARPADTKLNNQQKDNKMDETLELNKVTTALGLGFGADTNKIVAEINALRQNASTANETIKTMTTQLNEFKQVSVNNAVDDLVKTGKLSPAQKDWAINYALKDNDGFTEFAKGLVPISLNKQEVAPATDKNAVATPEINAIAQSLGLNPDDVAKQIHTNSTTNQKDIQDA